MKQLTVTTTPVALTFGGGSKPLLQNLGPGVIYFSSSYDVSAANGFKLLPGMGYEFVETLSRLADWDKIVVVSTSTSDLRYGSVA